MTTKEQQIQDIREKCIKAHIGDKSAKRRYEFDYENSPIRLADILLAMPDYLKEGKLFFSANYIYHGNPTENRMFWNLLLDLEHQDEPTINFIWGLLQ